MFDNYIKDVLEAHQNNHHIYWDIYLDEICGFTELEAKIFAEALNIELHPQLHYFFTKFGRCSGGIFLWEPYYLYSPSNSLNARRDISIAMSKVIFENNVITQEKLDMKPYIFGTWDNCYFHLVFTKDKNLLVWIYDEKNQSIYCTGMNYLEFGKDLIKSLNYNPLLSRDYIKNKRLTKEQVLSDSTCYIFDNN